MTDDRYAQELRDRYIGEQFASLNEKLELSLRDQFAMAALTGFLMHPENGYGHPPLLAKWAYEQADAMLEARKK